MGIFKSKEEKIVERKEWERRIADSPMTQVIQNILYEKYGRLDSEEVVKLRKTNGGSYRLKVESKGFVFTLINESGATVDAWGISFDTMDYEDLPPIGVQMLKEIMLDILTYIPHLSVLDSGYIVYNTDRPKNAW